MANKTIHQLTPASTVTSDYELAVYDTDNDSTKKATVNQILSNITIIGEDSLTTTAQTLTGAINEHQTDISTLNDNLNFYYKSYSYSVNSLSSGSILNMTATNFGILPYPTGYTPIGILRAGASKAGLALQEFSVGSANAGNIISIRNVTSSTISDFTVDCSILYVKSQILHLIQ